MAGVTSATVGARADAGASRVRAAEAAERCVITIFGITGDLAARKLIPALYHLARSGALPESFAIVGVSRSVGDDAALRQRLREGLEAHSRTGLEEPLWKAFAERIYAVKGGVGDPDTYAQLEARSLQLDAEYELPGNRLYYMAVAPSIFGDILHGLKSAGLVLDPRQAEPWSRVIVEKPFGFDLETAQALNDLVAEVLAESQTYRIDHYLGKETVQNILVFRFANAIFEPLWNRNHIDFIEVTAAETLLVSNRGAFYDQTSVVRDIVQNHLLQILALVAMEPPVSLDSDHVRDAKVNAVRSLRPIDVDADVVFGQYAGYRDVEGVAPGSRTPTFVAMRLFLDNWRWHGVPIYVRAGKGMNARDTEVAITFKPAPGVLFGSQRSLRPNRLILEIQPNDGVDLQFESKVPGEDVNIGHVTMKMRYAEAFSKPSGDAYERLLLDAMRGDATLFARRDEVEAAWALIDPVTAAYASGRVAVESYEPGGTGPDGAEALVARDGREWRALES